MMHTRLAARPRPSKLSALFSRSPRLCRSPRLPGCRRVGTSPSSVKLPRGWMAGCAGERAAFSESAAAGACRGAAVDALEARGSRSAKDCRNRRLCRASVAFGFSPGRKQCLLPASAASSLIIARHLEDQGQRIAERRGAEVSFATSSLNWSVPVRWRPETRNSVQIRLLATAAVGQVSPAGQPGGLQMMNRISPFVILTERR